MRGRVMSMMSVILFGLTTLGGLLVGVVGDRVGVPAVLAAGGVVIALAAAALGVAATPAFRAAGEPAAAPLEAPRRAAG